MEIRLNIEISVSLDKRKVDMKNLFDTATATEIKERIGRLGPGSKRQWGKMSAAQAMAHCATTMEWAVGDSFAPRMFVGRMLGPLVKAKVLRDDAAMRRNAPTPKSLVVADDRDHPDKPGKLETVRDAARRNIAQLGSCVVVKNAREDKKLLAVDQPRGLLMNCHVQRHLSRTESRDGWCQC